MIVTKGMYDKEFKFDNNGKEESILIKPLPTKYLKQLFRVIRQFNEVNKEGLTDAESTTVLINTFAESDVLPDLVELITETVKKAYPDIDAQSLEEFVQINMFKLLPFIIDVNFKK